MLTAKGNSTVVDGALCVRNRMLLRRQILPVNFAIIETRLQDLSISPSSFPWVVPFSTALLAQWPRLSRYFNNWNIIQNYVRGVLRPIEIVQGLEISASCPPTDVCFGYRNANQQITDATVRGWSVGNPPKLQGSDFVLILGVSNTLYSNGDRDVLIYRITNGKVTPVP